MIAVYATKNKDNLNQDAPVAVAKGNAIGVNEELMS
jgi:hypothetical protein